MTMKHVVLATYELHPVNPGGAGVLLAGAVRTLCWGGFDVTVLCDFPEPEVAEAQRIFAGENLAPGRATAVSVSRLLGKALKPDDEATIFETKSKEFALAAEALHRIKPIHLLEFPDYAGLGFSTLVRRMEGSGLASAAVVVRLHGGLEFIDQVEGVRNADKARLQMYRLERLALQLTDYVFAPSRSIYDFYRTAYGLTEKFYLSVPPVENLTWDFRRTERFPDPGYFLFYGKLQHVKGPDVFIAAAVSIIAEHPERRWRFTLVGSDTHCYAHGRPTSECLRPLIPSEFKHAFEFVPSIPREQLPQLCAKVQAAVVPSRFETFCLAAHELRTLGLPLIVSSIPAFADYFSEATGSLIFKDSAIGLKNAMLRMSFEPGLADALAERPRPTYSSLLRAYEDVTYLGRPKQLPPEVHARFLAQAVNAFPR
jgi:glycosyltransferase involved in cell wall biosynthesis